MQTEAQIAENKATFEGLVKSISRPGADLDGLLAYLDDSGFYTAPASTQYHCSYDGGLCVHSLDVYGVFKTLMETFSPDKAAGLGDSIKLIGLFHDLAKAGLYEVCAVNKKVYSEGGNKKDEIGKFSWESIKGYKVKEASDRLIAGSNGFNSLLLLSRYVPLTEDEMTALVNSSLGLDSSSDNKDLCAEYRSNPFSAALSAAETLACYVLEK